MSTVIKNVDGQADLQKDLEAVASRSKADEQVQPASDGLSTSKVKRSELILFTTQLAVMLESGVVLSDAIDSVAEQTETEVFRQMIKNIASSVKAGETFSKALSKYPRVFNSMFISMVKASEASGKMPQMLSVLSDYLSFEEDTKQKVKGALTYPAIMAVVALAATFVLMFFVLPKFVNIYEAKGAALPQITQILISASNFLHNPTGLAAVFTTGIILFMGIYYWKSTTQGRHFIDYVKLRTPIIGTMFIDTVVTRSMRIMATMVNTGVNLLDTIEVIEGSCDNYCFKRLWRETDNKIRDGYQLSEAIQLANRNKFIAPGILQMLRAGEKSGKIGFVSDKISLYYEKKLHTSIKAVTSIIEPAMITVLGVIIGTIAIALLLPVFRISTVVAH